MEKTLPLAGGKEGKPWWSGIDHSGLVLPVFVLQYLRKGPGTVK